MPPRLNIKPPTQPLPPLSEWPREAQDALVTGLKNMMAPLSPERLAAAVAKYGAVTPDQVDDALRPLGLQLDRQRTGYGVLVLTHSDTISTAAASAPVNTEHGFRQ